MHSDCMVETGLNKGLQTNNGYIIHAHYVMDEAGLQELWVQVLAILYLCLINLLGVLPSGGSFDWAAFSRKVCKQVTQCPLSWVGRNPYRVKEARQTDKVPSST